MFPTKEFLLTVPPFAPARSSGCEGGLLRSELLKLDFGDAVVRMATFKKVMKAAQRRAWAKSKDVEDVESENRDWENLGLK